MFINVLIVVVFSFLIISNLRFIKKHRTFKFSEKFSIFIIIIYVLALSGQLVDMIYLDDLDSFFELPFFEDEIFQIIGYSLLLVLAYYLTYKSKKNINAFDLSKQHATTVLDNNVKNTQQSNNTSWQEYLDNNFKPKGKATATSLSDIRFENNTDTIKSDLTNNNCKDKFCRNCGSPLLETDNFCAICGKKIN